MILFRAECSKPNLMVCKLGPAYLALGLLLIQYTKDPEELKQFLKKEWSWRTYNIDLKTNYKPGVIERIECPKHVHIHVRLSAKKPTWLNRIQDIFYKSVTKDTMQKLEKKIRKYISQKKYKRPIHTYKKLNILSRQGNEIK